MINRTAEAGFGEAALAERYERVRPTYPKAAIDLLVDELGLGPGRTVLDLAAGTGKLTRLLVRTGATVVAVEPLAAMRDQLVTTVSGVEARDGTAESIPLPDGSVDAVCVAQAFHWFRADEALAEIARVLRPGGGLAMLWNERDDTVPWVAELTALMHEDGVPYDLHPDWAATVERSALFTPLRFARFAHGHELDRDGLVGRVLSSSYVATASPARQAAVERAVRRLVADFDDPFLLPYVTEVYWCSARTR